MTDDEERLAAAAAYRATILPRAVTSRIARRAPHIEPGPHAQAGEAAHLP